jgi:hypothetical protein
VGPTKVVGDLISRGDQGAKGATPRVKEGTPTLADLGMIDAASWLAPKLEER